MSSSSNQSCRIEIVFSALYRDFCFFRKLWISWRNLYALPQKLLVVAVFMFWLKCTGKRKKVMENILDSELPVPMKENMKKSRFWNAIPQSAFTFSKLTIETLEQGVKYVQS